MTRAERKTARRELAAWLRQHGLAPTGDVWEAAGQGVRDLDTLARAAARCGALLRRRPDGACLPMGLRDGMRLPNGSTVVGTPVVDPETGAIWVVARDADGATTDVEFTPLAPVAEQAAVVLTPPPARPRRKAPAWVQAAAQDYRDARDAWEAARTSCQVLAPSTVPGTAGTDVVMAQLEPAEYRQHVPAPRYSDFLREHAQRRRDPATA